MPARIQADADVFNRVEHTGAQRIPGKLALEQRALHTDGGAGAGFVIDALKTLIIGFMVIKLGQQVQLAAEKPRLFESEREILPQRSELDAQAELLAATGEVGRME